MEGNPPTNAQKEIKVNTMKEINKLTASKISYTFPQSAPAPFTGKTVTGGVPKKMPINGKIEIVVEFAEKIQGKGILARISDKPKLAAEVDRYYAEISAINKKLKDDLEAAVPGLEILRNLKKDAIREADRFHDEFNRMMEDEENDGANPPDPENFNYAKFYNELAAKYARAALYLKAESQSASTAWADNTGKGMAAIQCRKIIAEGGSIEDAEKALAVRREFNDWI